MAYHNELGKIGEEMAVAYLVKEGYTILERNYTYLKAEIDIIAKREPGFIVVVEVKTRNSAVFGNPQEFVSKSKVKLLVRAANEYVLSNSLDVEVRFDIIAVLKNNKEERIEHFENAFYHF
ncbi:MAG TPA: YraN family protein [Flavobacteriaceae bacterium]|nr:YraN family protein [Flavobacteriaceae bacterium]MCB9212143.1 YraN family protein [Alteromonas sp.]HPF10478.1 YraN family protein [Flavobacteriaceae bacterium]HQU21787.1 YraN family protein [Flavobacteriaceae bacterium]HQU64689.1 YraN family protein [Flavobacteriaceae bacterium]